MLFNRRPTLKDVLPLEHSILAEYVGGKEIDENDRPFLKDLASVGMIRMGIDLDNDTATAATTDMGLRFLRD